jgi:hypothetical protein
LWLVVALDTETSERLALTVLVVVLEGCLPVRLLYLSKRMR